MGFPISFATNTLIERTIFEIRLCCGFASVGVDAHIDPLSNRIII